MPKRKRDIHSAQKITFVDLFAGIGGFHLALQHLGGECVYASEWNEFARKTYEANFKNHSPKIFENGLFTRDITDAKNQELIPYDADILCAGFPCQPFSLAGRKMGFAEARGNLFFELAKIIEKKKPKAIFLENVEHLKHHDSGKTFEVIKNTIENELKYSFTSKVVDASDHGCPTRRRRLFMIGFRSDISSADKFDFPIPRQLHLTMSDIFDAECSRKIGYTIRCRGRNSPIDDRRNWDGYMVDGKPRRLTSQEAKRMMGFSKGFKFPVTETQALIQLGNSVAVKAVEDSALEIIKILELSASKVDSLPNAAISRLDISRESFEQLSLSHHRS